MTGTPNHKTLRLGNASVGRLSPEIAIPTYDRNRVKPGIIHFGVGGFHRAHQAVYTDDVLSAGDLSWGIRGAGITPGDVRMHAALAPQDFLYTTVARDTEGEDTRVVGSIIDYIVATDDPSPLIKAMADESTRIISMTVTENGYCYKAESIDLDFDNPNVKNDVAGGAKILTIYGALRAALSAVRGQGTQPPTVLSCDNLPQNGDRLRKLFLQFLDRVDPELRKFVDRNVEFPNCMVDRITPITTDEQRTQLTDRFGIIDEWPVYCERFRQWVIEDRFPAGHPDWGVAGARFVSDVIPFERMKIRLLNGSHSALGYTSYMLGYRRVDLAMADADEAAFVRAYMDEITPTVGDVPGMDLEQYKDSLIDRFANPAIADQVLRLAQDGSKKIPNMILEPVDEIVEEGGNCPFAAFALAAWIRFLEGSDEEGKEILIDDPLGEVLMRAAQATRSGNVDPFFAVTSVFLPEVAAHAGLRQAVAE
ncbi:mannitol dehydrogenase family protein, partial [Salinispira pacifica]